MAGRSIDKALDAVGKLVLVHYPVAERTGVVQAGILVSEPAVVHNEELHAGFLALLSKSHQLALINVKIVGFPAI